jgi:hypothetical protein
MFTLITIPGVHRSLNFAFASTLLPKRIVAGAPESIVFLTGSLDFDSDGELSLIPGLFATILEERTRLSIFPLTYSTSYVPSAFLSPEMNPSEYPGIPVPFFTFTC